MYLYLAGPVLRSQGKAVETSDLREALEHAKALHESGVVSIVVETRQGRSPGAYRERVCAGREAGGLLAMMATMSKFGREPVSGTDLRIRWLATAA